METIDYNNNNVTLPPLIGKNIVELKEVACEMGLPAFQGTQIAKWIYQRRATSFEQMTDISLKGRERLQQHYCIGTEAPSLASESIDGTVKYLFDCHDGNCVEAVYIPEDDRATLCISSQKGCHMNCSFCMTGRQGFHGSLTAAQIINQILSIPNSDKLTNVVFMGMGEPMDNLQEVIKVCDILTSSYGLAWSPKRITVSTIGKLTELKTLIEQTNVHIAISVHSPYHEQRLSIMPIEAAYPIEHVMQEMSRYDFSHQRRLSIEYIMWKDFNDDYTYADALAHLLQGTNARVNLIRFHAIPNYRLTTSSTERMVKFRDRLNSHGVICTIRRSRGEDIKAACGMLAGKNKKTTN